MWLRSFALVYHRIARASVYCLWANRGLDLRRKRKRVIEQGVSDEWFIQLRIFHVIVSVHRTVKDWSYNEASVTILRTQPLSSSTLWSEPTPKVQPLIKAFTSIAEFFILLAIWPLITTLSRSWFVPLLSYWRTGLVRLYMVPLWNMGLSMTHMFKVVQFTCTQDWVAWLLAIGCFHQFVSQIWCVRLQWSVHVSRWEILLLLGSCLIKCPTRTLLHGM